jgi:hypothetical protein
VLPGQLDELGKRVRIVNGDLCEHLPIDFALSALQTGNQFAVAHPAHASRRIHSNDPQASELPLALTSIPESKDPGSDQGHDRLPIQVVPTGAKSFAQFADAFSLSDNSLTATSAGHGGIPRNPRS